MKRYLIEDETSGMLVSVPENKLSEYLSKGAAKPDAQLQERIKQRLMQLKEQATTSATEAQNKP